MSVKDFIKYQLSIESYSFSIAEVEQATGSSCTSLKFELVRLIEKGEILNVRKGFYVIIPARYATSGKLPIQLYVDKMFKYIDRNYYLGFYSAAKFHGASHQQIQRDYVMIELPKFNNIKKSTVDIKFIATSKWPKYNIITKTGDAGFFSVSSPALTGIDLIHHQTKLGGLNRMLAVLEELLETITLKDVEDVLRWYPYKSTLQRFGFLMEELGAETQITRAILEQLIKKPYYPVLLSPKSQQKAGAVDNIWKVDVNMKLESDL
ncbi:type IV toxin-antitoxin system AbiEi family antitoxin domain-containing protein [Winogradskyella forsetii]|uniref:type IV toxin-antitoxin system AbiEi family antitoxin domain-containing protein n=1 Tax=Winogradskyella forsetii TaxID=2686077 RepID=UPI0015B81ED0|nr:type IV toxin-antitoxin system AbiEi family antitoxin [Winogradskyella forsetii]